MKKLYLYFCLIVAFAGSTVRAEDKSQYHLFNPTPENLLRQWRTDQSGASPYTIDAGHFAAEISAVSFVFLERDFSGMVPGSTVTLGNWIPTVVEISGESRLHQWTYGQTTLKAGLANNLDAEVTLVPYKTVTSKDSIKSARYILPIPALLKPWEESSTVSGFGDVTSTLKLNLWGNEGGKTALALTATGVFPTGDNESRWLPLHVENVQAGPGINFSAELPFEMEMRINTSALIFESAEYSSFNNYYWGTPTNSVACIENFASLSRHIVGGLNNYYWGMPTNSVNACIENLASLSRHIVGGLDGFCAFDTVVSTVSGSDWAASIIPGLNYRINDHFDIFGRCGFGLNGDAFDLFPSAGLSVCF